MQRLNFTLDDNTIMLLDKIANESYNGNRSAVIRDSIHFFSQHTKKKGWVIVGFSPVKLDDNHPCHGCGRLHHMGDVLYQPTFQRGEGNAVFDYLPKEPWLDCSLCLENGNY